MKIKLSPLLKSPAKSNALAPIEKTFDPCDIIPMPMLLRNQVAGATSQSGAALSASSGGVPILVAEDDQNSSLVLKVTLERAGYAPLIARDGLEAMAVLREPDAPSIAVLDWMMPRMNGLEVCRRVRDLNKVVYIIFVTARATSENIVEALEAGADDYLTKPFKSPELIARIHVGLRVVHLQNALGNRVKEVEKALLELNQLRSRLSMPL
jgi:DNA-binding response OmpR family regulator